MVADHSIRAVGTNFADLAIPKTLLSRTLRPREYDINVAWVIRAL